MWFCISRKEEHRTTWHIIQIIQNIKKNQLREALAQQYVEEEGKENA